MTTTIEFEDIKNKDKIVLEKRMLKAGKAFVDFLSELQKMEQNIQGKYQVLNLHIENNIIMKRLIEEFGLSTDLSVRMLINNEPADN